MYSPSALDSRVARKPEPSSRTRQMKRSSILGLGLFLLLAGAAWTARRSGVWMGRQPDGSFLVSSGQRIEAGSIAFTGRPIDLALHPTRDLFAALNKGSVFLATPRGVVKGSEVP